MRISVTYGETVTIAEVMIGNLIWHGEAKCHPNDKPNKKIGEDLAMGRALRNASDYLIMRGNEKVDFATGERVRVPLTFSMGTAGVTL